MPLVSIIVTFHNYAEYLEQVLGSLVKQTLTDIEIICVDDSSTDNTPLLLKRFSLQDSRIKLLESKSQKVTISRNIGLAHACGEFVGFVDGDDCVDLNYYERLYNAAASSWPGGADGARSGYTSFSAYKETDDRFCGLIDQRVREGCLLNSWDNTNVIWNAIYRRETLIARDCYYFPEEPRSAEDLFWTLRAMHRLRVIVPVSNIRYRHRIGKSVSLSAINLPNGLNMMEANRLALNYINSSLWQSIEEYYQQFERVLWRYSLWEGRIRNMIDEDSQILADLHHTMRMAYDSCRHPSLLERLSQTAWWPVFMKAMHHSPDGDSIGTRRISDEDGQTRRLFRGASTLERRPDAL
jgi:glycosyltransferase involved in cell wall biosynthesis